MGFVLRGAGGAAVVRHFDLRVALLAALVLPRPLLRAPPSRLAWDFEERLACGVFGGEAIVSALFASIHPAARVERAALGPVAKVHLQRRVSRRPSPQSISVAAGPPSRAAAASAMVSLCVVRRPRCLARTRRPSFTGPRLARFHHPLPDASAQHPSGGGLRSVGPKHTRSASNMVWPRPGADAVWHDRIFVPHRPSFGWPRATVRSR